MRKKRLSIKKVILLVSILLVAAVLACVGYQLTHMKESNTQAKAVLSSMENLIPGFNEPIDENAVTSGMGRDPLAALSIQGVDIVGCLEIPALDLKAPVAAKEYDEPYFVSWVSGSPVKGKFRLIGGHEDVFLKLAKANPGDRVIFTDIDGVRYVYEVTTQYHLKDWAEATNDLLLCYPSDDKTDFVVGCTSVN